MKHSRSSLLNSLLAGLFLLPLSGCNSAPVESVAPTPGQPNILFLLLDDVGWNQVGYQGTQFYETPNIDRLARQGMQFSDAYSAAPICSPTRASILTGKYPARLHLTDFIAGAPFPWSKLRQPEWTPFLPLEEVTLAEVFKEHGYATGSFGKWHLNRDKNYQPGRPMDPASQGFDEVYTSVKPDSDTPADRDPHHVRRITEHALRFLDEKKDEPFFLYVSHHVVHTPLIEREALIAKYRGKPGADRPENNPTMGAMIETTDESIGLLLRKLDELGLSDNTLVVLFSDNGGKQDEQSQVPLRGGKSELYEGGIRVPLVIRWPGVVEPGSASSVPVTSVDFFPTLLEIAGIENTLDDIDGESMVGLLRQTGPLERDAIFFHYPHYHALGGRPSSAIRQGDYKLIEWFEDSLLGGDHPVALYNLKDDLAEGKDLSVEMPGKVRELRTMLELWRSAVGAQLPTENPGYDPKKAGNRR